MTTIIKELEIESAFRIKDECLETIPVLPASSSSGMATPLPTPELTLTAEGTYPTANIRIALQEGEAEKAQLLLGGEISRVDPATAERLTHAILEKSAETLLDLTTDYRRQGLFLLPFRVYTMTVTPDGTLSFPSPQAIALPTDYPPHPEITASSVTDDCLTLALRFPVKPHRLTASLPDDAPSGYSLRTFISYPLYIPDPKEMKGSIGSVRSATGGNATGIRFAFLSTSALKASVAAPEKYYEIVGNVRTGYRIASKAAAAPDYSVYARQVGTVSPFPAEAMLLRGTTVSEDTDPLDWIADWTKTGMGYLPNSLPYINSNEQEDGDPAEGFVFPEGIDGKALLALAKDKGMTGLLLTRPMAFGRSGSGKIEPVTIKALHIQNLPDTPCLAILYGSNDCRHWQPLRLFDPHSRHLLAAPPRLWHRLLLLYRGNEDFSKYLSGIEIIVSFCGSSRPEVAPHPV